MEAQKKVSSAKTILISVSTSTLCTITQKEERMTNSRIYKPMQ
jgi:hypothetical protein